MSVRDLPPEQQLIRQVVERALGPLRDLFYLTLRDTFVPYEPIAAVLTEFGDNPVAAGQVYQAMGIDEELAAYAEQLLPVFERLLLQSGSVGAPVFASSFSIQDFNLEGFNAAAQDAARQYVGQQITQIQADELKAVQEVIERGFEEGVSVADLARSISGIVGLDAQRARGLDNFAQELLADPGDRSPAQVQAAIERERRRRLKQRGQVIARTEVQRAAGLAQNLLWEQAVADGKLNADVYVKQVVRIPASKPCPICDPLKGMTMPIGGDYYLVSTSKGETRYGPPPFHPNCRCGERLVRLADVQVRRAILAWRVAGGQLRRWRAAA